MPEGRQEPDTELPICAIGAVQGDREPKWLVGQALDQTYAVLLETLRELEAVCDPQRLAAA